MSRSVLLLALAACNAAFGIETSQHVDAAIQVEPDARIVIDRDNDGIEDADDDCIAGIGDRAYDHEGDSFPNETDPCPFDYESFDADNDTVFDDCDPFPALAGDTSQCVMAFQSAPINVALWIPRAGDEASWRLLGTSGLHADVSGTLMAAETFERSPTTSYDVLMYLPTATSFTLWLRAGASPAAGDVGCEVSGNMASTTLTVIGAQPPAAMTIPRGVANTDRIRATVATTAPAGQNNVRCVARVLPDLISVSGQVTLTPGHVGFGAAGTMMRVQGLTIMRRDDVPPL